MSKQSENYKNLIKKSKCCEPIISLKYVNTNNISTKMRQSQLLQSNSINGKIQYGNFGNIMNASPIGNEIISNLVNVLQNNPNTNNYVYVVNTINSYSYALCNSLNIEGTQNKVNYNEFYKNYKQLEFLLNQPNLSNNLFIKNNYY
jgi:hypothetical protein